MALIDNYRRQVLRGKERRLKLLMDQVREEGKALIIEKKILEAQSAIERTKSQSVINSKLRIIESSEKNLSVLNRNVAILQERIIDIDQKISYLENKVEVELERMEAQRLRDERRSR
ncbi:MAG: hypothetical protein GX130_00355 [Candidatus Hydrogenedens sp.]|jgi:hypothetical protein|nr:hypothetical protein [Candidatus Hydrogenedens sp.]